MDNSDQSTCTEELTRAVCLADKKKTLPHTGYCYNCGEPTTGVYCDSDCREDGEQRLKFNR